MEKLISETYYILQNLKKLKNDVGHEFDLDHYNIIRTQRHLEAFYQELIQAMMEKQRKDSQDQQRERDNANESRRKRRDQEADDAIHAALKISRMRDVDIE